MKPLIDTQNTITSLIRRWSRYWSSSIVWISIIIISHSVIIKRSIHLNLCNQIEKNNTRAITVIVVVVFVCVCGTTCGRRSLVCSVKRFFFSFLLCSSTFSSSSSSHFYVCSVVWIKKKSSLLKRTNCARKK